MFPTAQPELVLYSDLLAPGRLHTVASGWRAPRIAAMVGADPEGVTEEESRRMARDIHDGMAQELASSRLRLPGRTRDARSRLARPARRGCGTGARRIRRAIAARRLTTPSRSKTIGHQHGKNQKDVANRYGRGFTSSWTTTDLRTRCANPSYAIVTWAVTNAACHGRASEVTSRYAPGRGKRRVRRRRFGSTRDATGRHRVAGR